MSPEVLVHVSNIKQGIKRREKNYLFEKNLNFMLKRKTVSNVIEKMVAHGIHCLPCSFTNDVIDLSS